MKKVIFLLVLMLIVTSCLLPACSVSKPRPSGCAPSMHKTKTEDPKKYSIKEFNKSYEISK